MANKSRNRKAPQPQTQVVVTGTNMRMETAKSTRRPKPSAVDMAAVVAQEINPVSGFTSFLKEYAVVGLAIGFIVGLQAQTLVKALVDSFIDPLFQLLFGKALDKRTFALSFHDRTSYFHWGNFVHSLVYFLFVLAAIFLIVKIFNLDKFNAPSKADLDKIKEKHR